MGRICMHTLMSLTIADPTLNPPLPRLWGQQFGLQPSGRLAALNARFDVIRVMVLLRSSPNERELGPHSAARMTVRTRGRRSA
jgi:hypothetical protein